MNDLNEFLTQKEVAKRWKCSEGTVKNYREQGLLPCFQPVGLVRYLKKDIIEFEKKFTSLSKGGDRVYRRLRKEMPVISIEKDENWRI